MCLFSSKFKLKFLILSWCNTCNTMLKWCNITGTVKLIKYLFFWDYDMPYIYDKYLKKIIKLRYA